MLVNIDFFAFSFHCSGFFRFVQIVRLPVQRSQLLRPLRISIRDSFVLAPKIDTLFYVKKKTLDGKKSNKTWLYRVKYVSKSRERQPNQYIAIFVVPKPEYSMFFRHFSSFSLPLYLLMLTVMFLNPNDMIVYVDANKNVIYWSVAFARQTYYPSTLACN